jgi:CheY-like chemotaxis protein
LAKKRKIKFIFNDELLSDIYLYVDRTLLKQVMINLLSNAIKYNIDEGKIDIRAEQLNTKVVVQVIDTGLGIREDKKQYVFQPFNRLGAESSDIEGTGIGLVITQHMVKMMNGDIRYESQHGHGTVFELELDAGYAPGLMTQSKRVKASNKSETQVKGFTVLYIEDTQSNIRVVESILSRWSQIKLVAVNTAEQGIEIASDILPDVILMDVNLPQMNGVEAVSILKSSDKLHKIPVIAVSADALQASIKAALEAGFDRYLTKPLRMNELLTVLGQMTNQKLIS